MAWALWPLRVAQRLGLRGLLDRTAWMLPAGLRAMQEMVPHLEPHHGGLPEVMPAEGKRRGRVALLIGCAADAFYPQTTLNTARVLQKNGVEVWVPRAQGCCGALHEHAGLAAEARKFARANISSFGKRLAEVDAVITNAGGCGPVLKHYDDLMKGELDAGQAAAFTAKVRDIHEYLDALGVVPPTHPIPIRGVYHDACGLSHGQKIRSQPRRLLGLVPGLELVPLPDSEACCGAAGSYNITQPEMARRVGEAKARHILTAGARAVFTGNVGCLLQIAKHLKGVQPAPWVAHPIDVMWASYSGKMPAM
jgi:glycolate oxidase iron-sulfur subunit